MPRQWTIDTGVLYDIESCDIEAVSLILQIGTQGEKFVLDSQGKILEEYMKCLQEKSQTGSPSILKNLFKKIKENVIFVDGKVKIKTKKGLIALRFDGDDYCFVGACSNTTTKLLVSSDSDYSQPVKAYLKGEEGVSVLKTAEALKTFG